MRNFVTLPCFFHTESTSFCSAENLDYRLTDCDIRQVRFYNIDATSSYLDGENEYISIFSGHNEFICSMDEAALYSFIRNF